MSIDACNDKVFITIDSFKRQSGTSSDFLIQVTIPYQDYDCCCVTQASVPVSYYLIQIGYNTFQLQENLTVVTITIPAGNYNLNSFCIAVTSLLNSNSPNGWTYAMSYNNSFTQNNNAKITYTVTGNSAQPSFIFNKSNYLNEQFGFDSGTTQTFAANTLISSNVVYFPSENVLLLHSDIVLTSTNGILQELYSAANQNLSIVLYECNQITANSRKFIAPSNNVMHFWLTDASDVPINLNGVNFQFTIVFYKKSTFKDIVLKFIGYISSYFNNAQK